jgi:hypothetical protein
MRVHRLGGSYTISILQAFLVSLLTLVPIEAFGMNGVLRVEWYDRSNGKGEKQSHRRDTIAIAHG